VPHERHVLERVVSPEAWKVGFGGTGGLPRDWSYGRSTRTGPLDFDVAAVALLCAQGDREPRGCTFLCIPYPPYSSFGDLLLLAVGGSQGSIGPYGEQLVKVLQTNPFESLDAFRNLAENLAVGALVFVVGPEILLALPKVHSFVHSTVSNITNVRNLEDFGRFAGAFSVGLGVNALQSYLLKNSTLLKLAGADLLLSGGADLLDSAGAPSQLTKTIRTARILTNGTNAINDCSSGAVAGNDPPIAADALEGADVAKYYLAVRGEAKTWIAGGLPVPLVQKGTQGGTGILAPAVAGRYAAVQNALRSSVKGALAGAMTSFDGAGHNWTPDEFAACLAAKTIGF
jgi:hypothetical protein